MIQSEKSPTHARQSRRTLTFYSQLAHSSVKNQVTGSGNDIHALLYTQPHQVLLVRSHSILGQLFSGKSANSIGNFGKTIGSLGWLGQGVGAVRAGCCLDWVKPDWAVEGSHACLLLGGNLFSSLKITTNKELKLTRGEEQVN